MRKTTQRLLSRTLFTLLASLIIIPPTQAADAPYTEMKDDAESLPTGEGAGGGSGEARPRQEDMLEGLKEALQDGFTGLSKTMRDKVVEDAIRYAHTRHERAGKLEDFTLWAGSAPTSQTPPDVGSKNTKKNPCTLCIIPAYKFLAMSSPTIRILGLNNAELKDFSKYDEECTPTDCCCCCYDTFIDSPCARCFETFCTTTTGRLISEKACENCCCNNVRSDFVGPTEPACTDCLRSLPGKCFHNAIPCTACCCPCIIANEALCCGGVVVLTATATATGALACVCCGIPLGLRAVFCPRCCDNDDF